MSDYWTMKMIKEGYGLPPLTDDFRNIRKNGDKRDIMFGVKKLETKINCLTKKIDDLVIRLNTIDRITRYSHHGDKITGHCEAQLFNRDTDYIGYIYKDGLEYAINDFYFPENTLFLRSEIENNIYAIYVQYNKRRKYIVDLKQGNAILISEEDVADNEDED